jgi:hypothetical protein
VKLAALVIASLFAAPGTIQVGKPAANLDVITGVWESKIANAQIVGLSLRVIADAPFGTQSLRATPQVVRFIAVETYVRKSGRSRFTATWWNSDVPGEFSMQNGKLHFRQTKPFVVTLELTYDAEKDAWRGNYASPYYNGIVQLVRPRMAVADTPAGTWIQSSSTVIDVAKNPLIETGCLHVGLGEDRQFVLWGQYVKLNKGAAVNAETQPFEESYGELLNDTLTTHKGSQWSFTYANGVWSERVTGAVSSDGSKFAGAITDRQGNGAYDPGNRPESFVWKRAAGTECAP